MDPIITPTTPQERHTPHTPQPPAWAEPTMWLIGNIIEANRLEDRSLYRTLLDEFLDEILPIIQRLGAGTPELREIQAILAMLLMLEWANAEAS